MHKGIGQLKKSLNSLKLHPLLQTSSIQGMKGTEYALSLTTVAAMEHAEDALDASKISMKPGGWQPKMHDTYWKGKLQCMVFPDGTPKGLKNILMGDRCSWDKVGQYEK